MRYKELKDVFLKAKEMGMDVGVEVTIPGQAETEFIINKNASIDNKLEYYKATYNNRNLKHRKTPEIEIVDVFITSMSIKPGIEN